MKSKRLTMVAAILGMAWAFNAEAANRPNILWLTSEDHGPEMGCYGDKNASTPNVDALAAKGMIFRYAWSCAPVCAPARTTIISGLYPPALGAEHMRSEVPMPEGTRMYPQFLREAGYYCSNNNKEDYNLTKPKGVWDDSSGKAHWKNRAAGQPFFAIFNSTKSHESQVRRRPHTPKLDPAKVRVPAYHPDTPEVRRDWAQYYDVVSAADAEAGEHLRELADAGLEGDTIVFYYGDHGAGLPRSKRWPSNSGLRVPLVVYFPEKWRSLAPKEYKPGGQSDRLVSFVDLAPTLLSIAGLKPPEWMHGHAFAGPHQTEPQPFLYGFRGRMDERIDFVRSVTDGRYVYLRNFMPHLSQGQHVNYQFQTPTTRVWRQLFDEGKLNEAQSIFWKVPKAPEELYDLQTDPDEVRNLAGSPAHQATLEKFRQAQRELAVKIRDVGYLPEAEIHARSRGQSPRDALRDDSVYPLGRIMTAAETASFLRPEALPQLRQWLKDADSAVRYWAAMGLVMRGAPAVAVAREELRASLKDASPIVRVAAAQALGQHGQAEDLPPALETLRELAPADKNGAYVSMMALNAIGALGGKAAPLMGTVKTMAVKDPAAAGRANGYVSRLVADLTGVPVSDEESPPAKKRANNPKNK